MYKKIASLSLATSFMMGFPAYADGLRLSGEIMMEMQNNYTTNSDDTATDDHNDLFFRSEIAPTVKMNDHFFIDGVAVFERTQDRDANKNNWLDNEGLFIEEVKINYEDGPWAAWAGKFNPKFGSAWDLGRGIWSKDFAEDYEITERIGGGASYSFKIQNTGTHTISANTFFADTSFLSGSTMTNRDTIDKSDGGVSNTNDFSSYAVSIEGTDAGGIDNLYYQVAHRSQAAGDADVDAQREHGYAGTLGYAFDVTDRLKTDALIEYADIRNFDAGADDNRYVSVSFVSTYDQNWTVTLGYTARDIDRQDADGVSDHLLQLSGGYDFGQGTTAEIGWRSAEEDSVDSDIVGGLIRHVFTF